MWKKAKPYVISIAIALAVGGLSAWLTNAKMPEYEQLIQPALSPPAIVFPIVWSILFILMGISAAIVWKSEDKNRGEALTIYAIQLAANFLWTIIFFNLNARLFAFMWLILLLILVIIMTVKFYSVSKKAGFLQIPYILWLLFAGYLNLAIFLLNG